MLDWETYAGTEPLHETNTGQSILGPMEDWLTAPASEKSALDEFQSLFAMGAGADDDATPVDDVIVVGTRPGNPHDEWWWWETGGGDGPDWSDPSIGVGVGGGLGGPTSDGLDPQQDCPADQAARDAAAMFLAAAAAENQHLSYRERAAYIIRDDDGTYRLSGYREGLPMTGAVSPDSSELTPFNVVGMIHNHPGGTLNPSGPDRDNITEFQNWIWENGGTQEFREYVIGIDGKIYVYDVDNMDEAVSSLEVSGGCG
jgi:hypothetical protein